LATNFDPAQDTVFMAEVLDESQRIWSHKTRTTAFLSGMRHFAEALKADGITVFYTYLTDRVSTFEAALHARLSTEQPPQALVLVEPGEWGVKQRFIQLAKAVSRPLQLRDDTHFVASHAEFAQFAHGRKQLRQEYFYRTLRQKTGLLMAGKKPLGDSWNFDADNRQAFGKLGPPAISAYRAFSPDAITRKVMQDVDTLLPDNPGHLTRFDWPVTPADAALALEDFVSHRLPWFGQYQDAMWTDEPFLFHARLSMALNLKLIDPLTVCRAAEQAYCDGRAPLASVEGFIRQIIGWREYVRGIYWHAMPGYLEQNALQAHQPLPAFFWTGQTDMHCLRQVLTQTLQVGYAHHIQRLMVTGLFALLLGVEPKQVHAWYLAVYLDAVEWVELPNTLGMSQFADGGLMASKPYAATGKYIQRMSNYCDQCPYNPAEAVGPTACPFTTLYWDFLLQHEPVLRKNPRMGLQIKNLDRLANADAIQQQANQWRLKWL
jgi:deoxyribodipyrimidine photolyase-related protein